MTNFATITEKEILYYAIHGILERKFHEEEILEKYPDSIIERDGCSKLDAHYRAVHDRLIQIIDAE